jgi:hypothetical protein
MYEVAHYKAGQKDYQDRFFIEKSKICLLTFIPQELIRVDSEAQQLELHYDERRSSKSVTTKRTRI